MVSGRYVQEIPFPRRDPPPSPASSVVSERKGATAETTTQKQASDQDKEIPIPPKILVRILILFVVFVVFSQRISPGSSKYTSITSPVGQYIRGLSPTVQSPSRRPKSASAKPLHSAYAHSPRVTLGSVPASALTVSPFARNSNTRPKPSLAKVESPISSPLLTPRQHDDARLSGKTRLDRQELLLSPQAVSPAQEAKEDHAAEDTHVVMKVPSPSPSSSSSHQLAKGTKPVLDLALEERHARHQSQQKEAEHERMVATQRQHVARVMATYAIARGRANAMGMLRTQAKAEAKRRASLEPPVCSEDHGSSVTSDAVMKGAMHEVVDHFVASDESHESAPEELFAKHQSQVPPMDQDELVGLLFVKTPEDAATAGLCASRQLDARPVSPYECQLSPDSENVDEVSTLLAELECTTPGSWVVDSVEAQSKARGSKAIEIEAQAGQNEVKEEEAEVQKQEEDDDDEEEGLLSCRELAMPSSALNPKRIRISGTLKLKPLARTFSSAGGTTSAAWKAHWVVVHLNFLFIYRTQDSKRPLVVALLDSAEVEPVGNDAKRFMVRTRVGRKLFFEAESPQNAARWRKELGQSGYEHVRAAVAAGSPLMPFGSQGKFEFPSTQASLNEVFLSPGLQDAARELLQTREVRLTQGDAWFKSGVHEPEGPGSRAPYASVEQRMHMDFPNHDLNHPPPFDAPETVAIIVYLDDADACDGKTGVVPRRGASDPAYAWPYRMPGVGVHPWINDRAQAEAHLASSDPELYAARQELYRREELVDYRIGTVLLYRHDLWHRGRPVRPGASRLVCNLVFKKSSTDRVNAWNTGFARFFYNIKHVLAGGDLYPERPTVGAFERLFVSLTPAQRAVLGFPWPGDSYWTPETLVAAEARWGVLGMDLSPYIAALPTNRDRLESYAQNTDVDDDALARSIRESMLSASAQDALQRLRGGPRATKDDSLQAQFHAAVRKSKAQSQDDEALLSLVLRVMTRFQSPSKSDLLTSDGLGSTQRMMCEEKHPATSDRDAETETYENSDCFEDVYLGMMQHVSAFPQARREGDARDRECLVRALREVLLDANSVLSIKARFATLRATNVGCDGDGLS
ncbi:Hypothetical Protein FCC1311_092322 [Hondaea fermentalgiana]|uniref:PH domain-containing protein n=1 Tax=Hondaea fermentalgiana TaxID=2315210 RepID=A0A2R5GTC8_9STRA|nr:Hypothetical Protein FCC1311_092322 [Hondaea fermentalgiana]|eukprot:GBG33008.1 Hypothetical Protein FCC1311_092322 [Hondaea fermentalgiana]